MGPPCAATVAAARHLRCVLLARTGVRKFTLVDRVRFGEIPALVAYRDAPEDAAARGTVLVYHPLGRDKSLHADDLERLATRGFLAVGVDAIAHGERGIPDGWRRFWADPLKSLLEVVTLSTAEVPGLIDALEARGWAARGRIGIAGVSLGGFIAYAAALLDARIGAAACVNASPSWGDDPRSPDRRPDAFYPLALLSITSSDDQLVPTASARALHEALAPRYAGAPDRLRYLEVRGEGHQMSARGWAIARDEVERWFERFLEPPGAGFRPPASSPA
jgi:dienelactone hydrolase